MALIGRVRLADRKPADRRADEAFLSALIEYFGDEPFARGNLDAGRLSWFFGREVVAAGYPFDARDYEALLRVDLDCVNRTFPELPGRRGSPRNCLRSHETGK